MSEILKSLPHNGSWHYAQDQRYEETIVFVHYFGGSPKSMRRHVEMVNNMGFNAVTFQLVFNELKLPAPLPISPKMDFGIFAIWRDQIESVLNSITGKKIIYSFSNPCFSAIAATGERHASDIIGIVCDSGPARDIIRSWWNLVEDKYKVKNIFLKTAMLPVGYLFIGLSFKENIPKVLKAVPEDFPILSIRGWQDHLVPYEEIEAFFDQQDHLDLRVISLPKGGHLDGLKQFPGEYVPAVKDFLEKISKKVPG